MAFTLDRIRIGTEEGLRSGSRTGGEPSPMGNRTKRYRSAALAGLFAAVLAVSLGWTKPAFAYIDPGSGSMILQGILAAVAGAGVAIAGFWGKIKAFFAGRPNAARKDDRTPGT